MRIVLDTNILVSALISGEGAPGQVLAAVKSLGITLITSRFQVDELRDVLARDRLQPYIRREEADDLRYHLEAVAVVVAELPEVSLSPDPDDSRYSPPRSRATPTWSCPVTGTTCWRSGVRTAQS